MPPEKTAAPQFLSKKSDVSHRAADRNAQNSLCERSPEGNFWEKSRSK
jgi:hypothetical protein